MGLLEAFTYPFQRPNLFKAFTIILVLLIFITVIFSLGLMTVDEQGTQSRFPYLFFLIWGSYLLFMIGYTVEVVRALMQEEEKLPNPQIFSNLGDGFLITLALIIHLIPFYLFWLFSNSVMRLGLYLNPISMYGMGNPVSGIPLSFNPGPAIYVWGIFVFIALIWVLFSLIVGALRYTAEKRIMALFEVWTNMGYITMNLGATAKLIFGQIVITLPYAIISNVIASMLETSVTGVSSNSFNAVLLFTVIYGLDLIFNVFSQLSYAKLYVQYGEQLGIVMVDEKAKTENKPKYAGQKF